ncbi:hypothetical protein [Thalassovita taeanensis]|nr:hypothetical protein [Thalassovita taeanensis]
MSETHFRITSDLLVVDLSVPDKPNASDHADYHNAARDQATADSNATQQVLDQAELIIKVTLTQLSGAAKSDALAAKRTSQACLATLVCQMAVWMRPEHVQWLSPDTILDTDEFIKAVTRVMPRRVRNTAQRNATRSKRPVMQLQPAITASETTVTVDKARFPTVEETTHMLESEYKRRLKTIKSPEQGAQNLSDIRAAIYDTGPNVTTAPQSKDQSSTIRLATWMVALTVGVFSLPVAVSLAIINLFRGEDLRLAGQSLALTGLLVTLNASGATAQVLQAITG